MTGLVVGFCGGYKTFSTFAQESLDVIEAGDVGITLVSIVASMLVGIAAVFAGAIAARLV